MAVLGLPRMLLLSHSMPRASPMGGNARRNSSFQIRPTVTRLSTAGMKKMERNKVLVLPFRLFSAKAMSKEIKITPISSMMV